VLLEHLVGGIDLAQQHVVTPEIGQMLQDASGVGFSEQAAVDHRMLQDQAAVARQVDIDDLDAGLAPADIVPPGQFAADPAVAALVLDGLERLLVAYHRFDAAEVPDEWALRNCTAALAAAGYLSRAIRGYRRETRVGRVPFAIDELMAAGVDNDDLAADPPPAHLRSYLDALRGRAAKYFETAAQALPRAERSRQRHLLVLAALGLAHLNGRAAPQGRRRLKDMLLAWTTARSAPR